MAKREVSWCNVVEDLKSKFGVTQKELVDIIKQRFGVIISANVVHDIIKDDWVDKFPSKPTIPRILYAWLQIKCRIIPSLNCSYIRIKTPWGKKGILCLDETKDINNVVENLARKCTLVL